MASGNKQENDRLGREHKRPEINMNIARPEGFPSNELNTGKLKTRALPVSPPAVPLDLAKSH